MSVVAFVSLLVEHGGARWVGLAWMAFGVALYVAYRTSQGKSVLKRVTVPEAALTRRKAEAEFGSMLVPILGTPLDDDIMQTAGRLAAEDADPDEGGAVIEALWIFEVPMSLPLDTRVPDDELKRARAALRRAKAVGEEYEGVEVATAVVRARRAGRGDRPGGQAPRRRGRRAGRRGADAPARRAAPTAASRGCTTRSWGRRPATWSTRRPAGSSSRAAATPAPVLDPMGPRPAPATVPTGHPLARRRDGAR